MGHLGTYDAFDFLVGSVVEGATAFWLSVVPANRREMVANFLEGGKGCCQVGVVLNEDFNGSFCFAVRLHFCVHGLTPAEKVARRVRMRKGCLTFRCDPLIMAALK